MFKKDDKVICVEAFEDSDGNNSLNLRYGETYVVEFAEMSGDKELIYLKSPKFGYYSYRFVLAKELSTIEVRRFGKFGRMIRI